MSEFHILRDLVLIIGLSVASLFVCHRLKLPPIIGFLLTGVAIGPYGFTLIRSVHEVDVLAEIGVVLLLFTIGLEFSLKDLLQSKRILLSGGALQVMLTIGVTALVTTGLGLPLNKAVFVGFLIALSSTAIVVRTLQERGEHDSAHGRATLSILIFQDIVIAPMMILTPILASASADFTGSLLSLAGKAIGVVALVVLLSRYVVPFILYQVALTRSRELFLLSTVLLCLGVAWSTNGLGLSLGLGAFLAGLVISESEYSSQALEGILPFKEVFASFFFVSVGMLLDTSQVLSQPMLVFGTALAVTLVKAVVVAGVALLLGLSSRLAIIVALALSQVGEFSFILSQTGIPLGLLDFRDYQIFLAVSLVTMAATPFIIRIAPRVADRLSRWPGLQRLGQGSYSTLLKTPAIEQPVRDHLIIIGFGVTGRNLAHAARVASIPYLILELNPDTVRAARREGEPIVYGDAAMSGSLKNVSVERARVVVATIPDPVAARRIIHAVREVNPSAHVIVRTHFVREVQALLELGASEVIPEEFETSVEIFTRVLTKYLVPRSEIESFTAGIRASGYEMFRSPSQQLPSLADLRVHLAGIEIESFRLVEASPVIGKTLAESGLRARFGVTILAITRDGKLITNPAGSERLQAGDTLYVIGPTDGCMRACQAVTRQGG